MLSGNKGEWSEVYTFLKLVGDRIIHAGDSNSEKIEGLVFPVQSVIRNEIGNELKFTYLGQDQVQVHIGHSQIEVPRSQFQELARGLLARIKSEKSTFRYPEIESFLEMINIRSLKAQSTLKTDISVVVYDQRTGTPYELGFSIKSELGGASTLLNAGKTTNFIYKIDDIRSTDKWIEEINSLDSRHKIKDRISGIYGLRGSFEFVGNENPVFENNLKLIDTQLPFLLSHIVMEFYSSNRSTVRDLVDRVTRLNPLNFDPSQGHPFYEYKLKRFLTDVALGMMPSKVWTGDVDATGGFLIVKDSGDILCYHIYSRNEFENYLINKTKLETASSKRHGFGKVYRETGNSYIKLNLQIRFQK